MTYTKINYAETEQVSNAMHFLREPLGCQQMGVTLTRCKPDWYGQAHDHTDDGHEEVYLLIGGEASVRIEGEDVPMKSGDAVRVPSEATRQIRNGNTESTFVIVSAPGFDTTDSDEQDWILTGFQG